MNNSTGSSFSLTSCIHILIRRWFVVVIVFGLCILAGIGAYLGQPARPFPHTTILEIGSVDGELIESQQSALAKMERVFLQRALLEHAEENEYETNKYSIQVTIPDNTDVLVLEAFGDESQSEDLLSIQQRASEQLIEDHYDSIEQQERELLSTQFEREQELEKLQGKAAVLIQRQQDLQATDALLEQQIAEISASIDTVLVQRATLVASEGSRASQSASLATALLVIDTDIQAQRVRQQELEQERTMTIQQSLTEIDEAMLENEQEQAVVLRTIDDLQLTIEGVQATQYLLEPSRRLQSSLHGPSVFLMLSGMLGMVAGVFIAFVVDVVSRARRSAR